jgi:hypothetical protein
MRCIVLCKKNGLVQVVEKIKTVTSALSELITNNLQYKINNKKCLFCGEDTTEFIGFSKCNHIIASCSDCVDGLPDNSCVMCRSQDNEIKKVYVTL